MFKCRYCAEGHSPVEVLGLWIHRFSDRLISCNAHMMTIDEASDVVAPPPYESSLNSMTQAALQPD